MNQIQTGTSSGFPNTHKTTRRTAVLPGSLLMLALLLFTGMARATVIPTSYFNCTQSKTFTSTCVGSGYYANGWVGDAGYWEWHLSTVGYSGISMIFSTTKSAAAGPTSGQVYYNIGGSDIAVSGGSFTVTTSCVSKTIALPAACEGVSNLVIKVKMLGATANTATNRITSDNVFNGTSTSCTTAPAAGGTVSAATNPVCAGIANTLSLTGATGGAGITYQWQSSADGSSWSDISGATGLSYSVPTSVNDTTYYRVLSTCAAVPTAHTASSTLRLDVNAPFVAAIGGYTAPLTVGTTQNLTNATTGGVWSSSNASVATVNGSGVLTGLFGGTTNISYKVTDPVSGCTGSQTITVNAVWPNTIALYAGVNGTSTDVIPVPGDHTGTLQATGFGNATPCGSGGLSGLTLNVANNAYNIDSAHLGYKVYPDAGKALNMYRIHANARVSGTGATKAVLWYQYWSNGFSDGPHVSAVTMDLVSGSCGSSANSWDFNTGVIPAPNPTVNGITDSLEVRVYPFAPAANGGTFQLNSLEVYGIITTDDLCDGSIVTSADSVLPAVVNVCDSGARYLNYNIGSGGVAGVGIEYQWESSADGSTWADVDDATGIVYYTGMLHAGVDPDTTYYRMRVTCDGSLVAYSEPNVVTVNTAPADAGTISGAVASSILPEAHVLIGTNYNLASTAGTGGIWSSNDTSVVSIVSGTGVATPHIPGDAVITYRKATGGCFGTTKVTLISLYDHTKALYVGKNGNSTAFYTSADATFVGGAANLVTANWDSATACGSGGISGLVNTTTAQNTATNGSVTMSVAAVTTPITATQLRATLRKQPTGLYKAYAAYSPAGANTWTTSAPINVETDDCGYSHNELVFNFAAPISVDNTGYDFAVFGYNGTTTTTLQVNTISVIGTGGSSLNKGTTGVNNVVANAANIMVYPNPVENTLNIDATEAVNVAIFSIDGKKLIDQKNTKSVNVSHLVSGMYLIQVSNQNNMLLKTEKFIKK